MGTKTIGTLAYQIIADARGFKEGIVATKKELSAAKDIYEATRTPVERLSTSMEGVDKLFAKGAIDADTHKRAISQLKGEYDQLNTKVSPLTKGIDGFVSKITGANPLLVAIGVAAGAAAIGFAALHRVISFTTEKIREQYERLDELINSSEKLGIAASSFQDIAKAAGMADVEMSSASNAVEKMLIAVSKGDTAKFATLFKMLGLDVKALRAERPEEMMRDILKALEGVSNQADRVRIANTIFGDADILRMTAQDIESASHSLEQMGAHLSDLDVANLTEMDDAFKEMHGAIDVIFQKMATDLAPALSDVAQLMTKIFVDIASDETFVNAIHSAVDALRGSVVVAEKLANVLQQLATDSNIKGFVAGLSTMPGADTLGRFGGVLQDIGEQRRKQDENPSRAIGGDVGEDVRKASKRQSTGAAIDELDPESGLKVKFALPGGTVDRTTYAKDAAQELIEKLKEQNLELSLGADAYARYRAEIEGATSAQLNAIFAQQKAIKEAKEHNKMVEDSKKVIESLKTPYEKAKEDIENLAAMRDKGLLTADQFSEAREKRAKDFRSSQKSEEFRNPAMMRGSQEALQTIANAKFGNEDTLDRVAESLESIDKKTPAAGGNDGNVISTLDKA